MSTANDEPSRHELENRRHSVGRQLAALICIIALLNTLACSFAAGSVQSIAIVASESDAEILVDGRYVGEGTATVDLKRNRTHAVMARDGDRAGVAYIDRNISTVGLLDLIGGCFILLPWLGILAPGFWQLEPEVVAVALPPDDEEAEKH